MTHQIKRFSLVQTAKVAAALYFLLGIVGALVFVVMQRFGPAAEAQPLYVTFLAPFFYALFGFVFAFVACWIYNVVARFTGGIEFTLVETRADF